MAAQTRHVTSVVIEPVVLDDAGRHHQHPHFLVTAAAWSATLIRWVQYSLISHLSSISGGHSLIRHLGTRVVAWRSVSTAVLVVLRSKHSMIGDHAFPVAAASWCWSETAFSSLMTTMMINLLCDLWDKQQQNGTHGTPMLINGFYGTSVTSSPNDVIYSTQYTLAFSFHSRTFILPLSTYNH